MQNNRRYDIDCLRVIAIGLLLVYHTVIAFQPWGFMIGFITNDKPLESLWPVMAMLNIWRIPLLFFIAGMGVYFASQSRNWKELLLERTRRIALPLLFGIFVIVPIQICIVLNYYQQPLAYFPDPAHLWFLGNIFIYTLLLLPVFFYLKHNKSGRLARSIKAVLGNPIGLLLVVLAFIAEVLLLHPMPYELYAMTWHGFFIGLLAFSVGFCCMLAGDPFWHMLRKFRWVFLFFSIVLYIYRFLQLQMKVSNALLSVESNSWIFSVFAFGHKYLTQPGKRLRYLSEAAYPIYIIHMLLLNFLSSLLFPLQMNVYLKFVTVLVLTFAGCFMVYELLIRRFNFTRIIFGLKPLKKNNILISKKTIL